MKLIELLVQELPKRGGWPEGVYLIEQSVRGCLFNADEPRLPFLFRGEFFAIAQDWRFGKVTREQYESALAASQKPVWNGEGLPPIGCECEVKRALDWVKCKILFISDTHVVLMADEECCWNTCACQFRPLRTESERKHEAVLESICAVLEMVAQDYKREDEAKLIYEAIAAGKIPGVKLDD